MEIERRGRERGLINVDNRSRRATTINQRAAKRREAKGGSWTREGGREGQAGVVRRILYQLTGKKPVKSFYQFTSQNPFDRSKNIG